MARNERLLTAVLLLVLLPFAAFLCFWELNAPSVSWGDESTHVRAVQSIVETGEWWLPRVDGNRYFSKPPFKMWLSTVPVFLFGHSAASYRLIDGICGIGTLLLAFYLALRMFRSPLIAGLSGFALLGCYAYIFGHGVRMAVQDSMLVFLSTAALVILWEWSEKVQFAEKENSGRLPGGSRPLIAGVIIGCAGLTKSAAAAVPLAIFLLYVFLRAVLMRSGGLRDSGRLIRPLVLLVIPAIAIPALYFVPHCMFTEGACKIMFGNEVVRRVSSGFNNRDTTYFYFIRLWQDGQAVPPELLTVSLLYGLWQVVTRRDRRYLFLLSWVLLPVTVFSFIPSRLTWYIAPSFPAMALLAGVVTGRLCEEAARRTALFWRGKNGPAGALLFAAASFAAVSLLFLHCSKTAAQAFNPAERVPFDLFVTEVQRSNYIDGERALLAFRLGGLNRQEKAYLGMLGKAVIRSRDEAELSDIARSPFVLTDFRNLDTLLARRAVTAYRLFPPKLDREQWVFASCSGDCKQARSLTPAKRIIDFGSDTPGQEAREVAGLSDADKVHGLTVQAIEDGRASILVRGDALLSRFGTKNQINLARLRGDIRTFELYINERLVFEIPALSAEIRSYDFSVPPGVWAKGENIVSFVVREEKSSGDRPVVILNWLTVSLDTKSPEPKH